MGVWLFSGKLDLILLKFELNVCLFFLVVVETAGYVELPEVFKYGFIMAIVNLTIWGVVGTFWWKFLGLY